MVQTYSENPQIKQEEERSDDFVSPSQASSSYPQQDDFTTNLSSLVGQTVWSLVDQLPQDIHPLAPPFLFQSWTQHYEQAGSVRNEQIMPNQDNYIFTNMMPAPMGLTNEYSTDFSPPDSFSAPKIPPPPRSSSTSSPLKSSSKTHTVNNRRHSADAQRPHTKRASTHPSVASVVSLTAHEPVAKVIDGIEHITFLYSHDRLVKEYTVRTDVESVNTDDISMNFRIQNAIYPRANVDRSDYDGNRWNYETTCNQLGWKLCWLNREQLFGRRGLIQRAVDSYRNRHADMRSRRVTRQEKVANGTLRKRRVKKSISHIL